MTEAKEQIESVILKIQAEGLMDAFEEYRFNLMQDPAVETVVISRGGCIMREPVNMDQLTIDWYNKQMFIKQCAKYFCNAISKENNGDIEVKYNEETKDFHITVPSYYFPSVVK